MSEAMQDSVCPAFNIPVPPICEACAEFLCVKQVCGPNEQDAVLTDNFCHGCKHVVCSTCAAKTDHVKDHRSFTDHAPVLFPSVARLTYQIEQILERHRRCCDLLRDGFGTRACDACVQTAFDGLRQLDSLFGLYKGRRDRHAPRWRPR